MKACDFRAAGILDAARLAPLSAANEEFARNLAETFAGRFEVPCEIAVSSIDAAMCEAFVGGAAANSPYFHSLTLGSHAETGVLEIDTPVLLALLDCLMGGNGQSVQAAREVTEIEGQMAREIVKIVAQQLQNAWRAFNIEVKVGLQRSSEELLHSLPLSATALVPSFNIKIAELTGKFQLMLPIPSIAPFFKSAPAKLPAQLGVPASTMTPRLTNDLLQTHFGFELIMNRGRLRANEILNLSVGQVVALGASAASPAVASIGGRPAFSALPVRSGDHRAAQLLERTSQDGAAKKSGKAG
jgi:flagellar motor switch protein FliM